MDAAERTTNPAFTRLPPEMLYMVVEHVVGGLRGDELILQAFPTLKNLRLASRQFAYLPVLLDTLFRTVRLVATADHLDIVAKTDLTLLKRHAKRVVFEPGKESWVMTRDIFVDIILMTPFEEAAFGRHKKVLPQDMAYRCTDTQRREIQELGARGVAEKYLPFSDEQIEEGYKAYMARANAAKDVFDNGELARTWAKALGQLRRVAAVRVGDWEYCSDAALYLVNTKGKSWRELGPVVRGHNHSDYNAEFGHSYVDCCRVQAPVGEALFSAVLKSFGETKMKMKSWDIQYAGTWDYSWANNGQLEDVDLSGLTTLTFDPRVYNPADEPRVYSPADEAEGTVTWDEAIAALLRKCSSTLTTLNLEGSIDDVRVWPPRRVPISTLPTMSALTSLSLSIHLNLATFPAWLKEKCPSLTSLQLEYNREWRSEGGSWREFWDAIREHRNRMMLDLYWVQCNDGAEMSLEHWTGEESKAEKHEDPWMDITRSLGNYLSNKGEWNESCRLGFDD